MGPSRSCWNDTSSALQPEEITSKETRVSCVLSIKVPIKKCLETYIMILVYIYIYIYIYIIGRKTQQTVNISIILETI